jgi:hypothetical protein
MHFNESWCIKSILYRHEMKWWTAFLKELKNSTLLFIFYFIYIMNHNTTYKKVTHRFFSIKIKIILLCVLSHSMCRKKINYLHNFQDNQLSNCSSQCSIIRARCYFKCPWHIASLDTYVHKLFSTWSKYKEITYLTSALNIPPVKFLLTIGRLIYSNPHWTRSFPKPTVIQQNKTYVHIFIKSYVHLPHVTDRCVLVSFYISFTDRDITLIHRLIILFHFD